MFFTLLGFTHRKNVRVFRFQRVDSAYVRTTFTVDVDLQSLAEFHIAMQEAPLMCRRLLENRPEAEASQALALTTDDMREFADARKAIQELAAKKRAKAYRPHPHPQTNPHAQPTLSVPSEQSARR